MPHRRLARAGRRPGRRGLSREAHLRHRGLPEDQCPGLRRPDRRAGPAVRRRTCASASTSQTLEKRRAGRRADLAALDRPGRLPDPHDHHHRRAWGLRPAHAPDRGPRRLARPRPLLLRQAQVGFRGQALRDRGRRRLGARLDGQPAGHRGDARAGRAPPRSVPRAREHADRGAPPRRERAPPCCTRPASCARCTAAIASSA